jgi:hypothetical protein
MLAQLTVPVMMVSGGFATVASIGSSLILK